MDSRITDGNVTLGIRNDVIATLYLLKQKLIVILEITHFTLKYDERGVTTTDGFWKVAMSYRHKARVTRFEQAFSAQW